MSQEQGDAGEREVEAGGVGQDPEVAGEGERAPAPAATPLTAAITGFGIVASAVTVGL